MIGSAETDETPGERATLHVVRDVAGVARLVDYLKARLVAVPVTEIGDLITTGRVRIAVGGHVARGRTIDVVADGDGILVDAAALGELERASRWNPPWEHAVAVLHEDDDLVVVNKVAGMHVHPIGDKRTHTIVNALVARAGVRDDNPWGRWRPHVVQRLDFGVSGVLAVAKSAEAKAALVVEQKNGEVSRIYRANVAGRIAEAEGTIDAPVGRDPTQRGRRAVVAIENGRRAVTRWNVLERFSDRTLVELHPETGRTHQLRVHMAAIGHPIVGDVLYGGPALPGAGVIALHSTRLELRHPATRDLLVFDALPPPDFGLGSSASGELS